jgi:mannitol/fructose-specific phosphotransferase system IIA component (Ntr-type)
MNLLDIVNSDAIVPELSSTGRDEVIGELVDKLIEASVIDAAQREEIIESVLERERKGSTGFGRGVAIPHVKLKGVTSMNAAIGISPTGVDFQALDKSPVYSVFLLISPADDPEQHLQAMEVIFKNLSKETFRRFLRQATSVKDVVTLLEDADADKIAG